MEIFSALFQLSFLDFLTTWQSEKTVKASDEGIDPTPTIGALKTWIFLANSGRASDNLMRQIARQVGTVCTMRRHLRWRLWYCFAFYIRLGHYTRLMDTELKSILDDFGIVTSFIMAHEVSCISLNSSHLTNVDQLMRMKVTNRKCILQALTLLLARLAGYEIC